MAYIVVDSKTSSSITVYVDGLDTNDSSGGRQAEWFLDGIWETSSEIDAYAKKSQAVEFSGLSDSTEYTVAVIISKTAASLENFEKLTKVVKTEAKAPTITRPSKFSWTKSIVQQGKDAIIYDSDWNALTANINEVRAYRKAKGYTVSTPTEYSFTTAVRGRDFTAVMFNQAVKAIKGISGYGTYLSEVDTGWTVTAKRLNDLVSEINSVP